MEWREVEAYLGFHYTLQSRGTSPINPGRIPCQWAIEEINCAPEVAKERERKRPGRLLYITGVLLLGTQLQEME